MREDKQQKTLSFKFTHFQISMFSHKNIFQEQRWHTRLVQRLCARGPKFDPLISHPCFNFFLFCVASNTHKMEHWWRGEGVGWGK